MATFITLSHDVSIYASYVELEQHLSVFMESFPCMAAAPWNPSWSEVQKTAPLDC